MSYNMSKSEAIHWAMMNQIKAKSDIRANSLTKEEPKELSIEEEILQTHEVKSFEKLTWPEWLYENHLITYEQLKNMDNGNL